MNGMFAVGAEPESQEAGGVGRSMFAAASALGGFVLLLTALRMAGRRLHPDPRSRGRTRTPRAAPSRD